MTESFSSLLDAVARRRGDAPALLWDGGVLTWRGLDLRAGGAARKLARLGVRAGDTVALLLPNGREFVASLWGALKLGATVAPLNPLLSADERDKVLAHLEPALVIDEPWGDEDAAWDSVDATAPALILYTSGSTGQPRGAVLSHAALRAANESWAGPVMRLTPQDVVLAALPLAHSFGLNGALLAPLRAGATVAVSERFTPESALRAISRHRVTVFPGVATMFQRMLDLPGLSETACSTLRLAVSGAAPCPWELAEEWRRRSEVRVVDENSRVLGAGEAGELWIRTPAVMDGYLRAEEETRAVIQNGWFRTGDLGTISAEGFVSVVGRKKDMILRGGYSVVPGEVEAALLDHPAVAEAAVVGTPDALLGEEIAAFVTLRHGAHADALELVSFCRERLAAFKYPRRVSIVTELPRSATGKVLKWRLGSL